MGARQGRNSGHRVASKPDVDVDGRSNLAEMLLTEGMKHALAHALERIAVTAIDDTSHATFDVVDTFYGAEGVTLVLQRRRS